MILFAMKLIFHTQKKYVRNKQKMCVTNTHARLSLFITKLAANNTQKKVLCGVCISYLILNLQLPKNMIFFPVHTLHTKNMFMYPPKNQLLVVFYYAIVVSSCVV